MKEISLDQRHQIERDFHDQWAKEIVLEHVLVQESFEAVTAVENRRILEVVGDLKEKRVLDLGCGAGEAAVYFALKGADVSAVDISPGMLEKTQQLATHFGVKINVFNMTSEKLGFEENSFDVVYGSSVLHHSVVSLAIQEVARVLKKNGRAVFIDPLEYNPIINIYRKIAKDVRTSTEKPLTLEDIHQMKEYFSSVRVEHFWFFTMIIFLYMYFVERLNPGKERYWKRVIQHSKRYEKMFRFFNSWDRNLLKIFPWVGRFCWTTIIILEGKR